MMSDIFEIVPYENTIGMAHLSRDQLMEILEENASSYSNDDRFRGLWGMKLKLKPSAPLDSQVVF